VDAVAQRLDFDAILDRLDLTDIVLERVNLDLLVSEVLGRIDLVGLAEQVIDAIDLPEIIRESTGSMASDTVRGVRMQSIAGDEAISRAVDRLLLRHGRRLEEP
jgi:predicted RNase H-like nuclease